MFSWQRSQGRTLRTHNILQQRHWVELSVHDPKYDFLCTVKANIFFKNVFKGNKGFGWMQTKVFFYQNITSHGNDLFFLFLFFYSSSHYLLTKFIKASHLVLLKSWYSDQMLLLQSVINQSYNSKNKTKKNCHSLRFWEDSWNPIFIFYVECISSPKMFSLS